MNTMRRIVPWLFWSLLFLALTMAGVHENGKGAGTSNPRSYDHPPPVKSTAAQSTAQPCQSSAFPSPSLRTPSGRRGAASN